MAVCDIVFSDGVFIAASEARLSPFDRGFLFAHAAYEVTAVYDGKMVDFEGHIARLSRTLAGIDIPQPLDREVWHDLHAQLIVKNDLKEGMIYLQVTAGAYAARDFAGPQDLRPAIFMFADTRSLIGESAQYGIAAITIEDTRWARRDMKTTQLLSQALAYRRAHDAGAQTAILCEGGMVNETASANLWIVDAAGRLRTRDLSNKILAGITRAAVSEQAGQVKIVEGAFSVDEMLGAQEVFTTSATALVCPVIEINGQTIGSGQPGPVTRAAQRRYYQAMGSDVAKLAPWAL